jgi:RimJ/RimL family protein N-acetyltransferase
MIYGERIRLRAPERDDLPMFVVWLNDPEVRAGLATYLPISMAQEERWFESVLNRPMESQPLVIEVKELDNWVPIGNIGVLEINTISHSAELGIMIGNKAYWNKGYCTEAISLMLNHCFETLNLNRVGLQVFENNPAAVRCYEKVGFVHEGRQREAIFRGGKYLDVIMMSVLKKDWQKKMGN